jgi:hypothetical protein
MAGRTLQVTSKLPHHHQAYNYVTIIKNICASHTAPLVPRCPQENQPSHVEGWADETAYWIQANSHRLHSNYTSKCLGEHEASGSACIILN